MNLLSGKVAVITGAGRGIGRAVAKAYFEEGASLALISRTASGLQTLGAELKDPDRIFLFPGDVAEEGTVRDFVGKTMKQFGRIDLLVNNAGILIPQTPLHQVETGDWDESIRINLRGPFLMTKYVLPVMLRQKSGGILNVSSGAAKREAAGWGPYAVSKCGIEGLTRLTAAEVKSEGIRVNAINPGGTRTQMRAKAYPGEDPLTRPVPEEVAQLFVWLASEKAGGLTGQSIDYETWKLGRR